jgi:hypothetical protein
MKLEQWNTYRTRFLVKAKQLTAALSFTDHLGRQHCGRKGDYLVESCDGVLSIAPRQIFEDIYVPMLVSDDPSADAIANPNQIAEPVALSLRPIETLEMENIPLEKFPRRRRTDHEDPSRARRKSPQPVRTTRAPSHLRLM